MRTDHRLFRGRLPHVRFGNRFHLIRRGIRGTHCDIARLAASILTEHCPTGVRWARAAVILTDLTDRDEYVTLPGLEPRLDEGLADAIDAINRRYGSMHAGVGHAGIRGQGREDADTGASWRMRRTMLSRRATTRWDEIATVHAT